MYFWSNTIWQLKTLNLKAIDDLFIDTQFGWQGTYDSFKW